MDQDFATALDGWTEFYAALSAIAATLLGLLFVSVSLRLNLFRDAQVADVRDFAGLIFGQYLALVILGLVALFPEPRPATLGLPALVLGATLLGWGNRVAVEYRRLNRLPARRNWWSFAFFVASLTASLAFLVAGAAVLIQSDAGPLPWLAVSAIAMLAIASLGAWVLLSHAATS